MTFPLEQTRQEIAKFLARAEVFKKVLHVHGSIVECGVHDGTGLMTWAHLSSIYEPVNHTRRVIGFDTFDGFPNLSLKDVGAESAHAHPGGMRAQPGAYERIMEAVDDFDRNRPVGQIEKVELVKGDACDTIPSYTTANPHLVVSLLHLDFDIYEPTRVALDEFVPLIPRGGVIMFDELNLRDWPGETVALKESAGGIRSLRLERFPFTSTISYAVMR